MLLRLSSCMTMGDTLVSLLFILNIIHTFFWCFYCWFWACICLLDRLQFFLKIDWYQNPRRLINLQYHIFSRSLMTRILLKTCWFFDVLFYSSKIYTAGMEIIARKDETSRRAYFDKHNVKIINCYLSLNYGCTH